MNHTYVFRRKILIVAFVLTVSIVMAAIAQASTLDSSAAQIDVIRQPRPHPSSHRRITAAATSSGPGGTVLNPRPHPKSHLELNASGTQIVQP